MKIDNFSNPPPSIIKSIFITKFVDNEHNKTGTLEKWEYSIGLGFRILRNYSNSLFLYLKDRRKNIDKERLGQLSIYSL